MTPISRQEAANLMGVPLSWVDAMTEVGALTAYRGDGVFYVDEEEIHAKGFTDPGLKAASLEHVQGLLRKLGIDSIEDRLTA